LEPVTVAKKVVVREPGCWARVEMSTSH